MRQEAGLVFDRVAADYDRFRPAYPGSLVDAACSIAGLGRGSRVLEIGCGTGKLTEALAHRGLEVDAVDPGASLVEIARRRVQGSRVRFQIGVFEDADLPISAFEAIFSATAFHWIDPAVGWSKAARLLRPGGTLALLTHVGGGNTELDPEWMAAWREVLPEASTWVSRDSKTLWAGAEMRRDNISELWAWLCKHDIARPEAAELFSTAEITAIPIDKDQTAEESLALVRTTSSYIRLDAERQRRLEQRLREVIEHAGGKISSKTFATLVTARVRASKR